MTQPRIAIVYDWVDTPAGGAEQVLLALHEAFPEAPLYTSHVDREKTGWLGNWPLHTTWLQRFPKWLRRQRATMILSQLAFEQLDLHAFEIVISVSSATAKGVITLPHQLHLCYLLTPPRYLYSHQQSYIPTGWKRVLQPVINYLVHWDQVAQSRPDVVIPISSLVKNRIQERYQQETEVPLYPPVAISAPVVRNELHLPGQPFFLVVSRLVAYKKIEVAIQACQQLGLSLVVIGQGPAEAMLRRNNYAGVTWLGFQPTDVVRYYMRHAEAVLMPGQEDFGITALEAVAEGTPVILHHDSGAAEVLPNGKVAVHLANDEVETLVAALENYHKAIFRPQQLKQTVQKYATTSFVRHWNELVERHWQTFTSLPKGHS